MQDVGLEELYHSEGLEAELGGNWYLEDKSEAMDVVVYQSFGCHRCFRLWKTTGHTFAAVEGQKNNKLATSTEYCGVQAVKQQLRLLTTLGALFTLRLSKRSTCNTFHTTSSETSYTLVSQHLNMYPPQEPMR